MKKAVLFLTLLLFSCTEVINNNGLEEKKISIKGAIPKTRALPDVSHIAAIPIMENYSPVSIVENLKPIEIGDDGNFIIEGIENNIVIALLNIIDSRIEVVDLVALNSDSNQLELLPLKGVEPQEFDLGELDLSSSITAISELLPSVMFKNLSSNEISQYATLDDVYRNIENHINNMEVVGDKTQVYYVKPELQIINSIKNLYSGVDHTSIIEKSEIGYTLVQFSTLPIPFRFEEIGGNFSITSPGGETYKCPELSTDNDITDEGELFTRRYTFNESDTPEYFMIEYCWDNFSDAESSNLNHVGNVNFFHLQNSEEGYWIPEQGVWKYNWAEESFGEFNINFARPIDENKKFNGYLPVPELITSEDGRISEVIIKWYLQNGDNLELVNNMSVVNNLITNFSVELACKTYSNIEDEYKLREKAIHMDNTDFNRAEPEDDVFLVDINLINDTDDVEDSSTLKDGKIYLETLWLMYDIGNELSFSFTWGSSIKN